MLKHSLICQLDKDLWINLLMVPMTCSQDMLLDANSTEVLSTHQTNTFAAWGWLYTRIMKAKRSLVSFLTSQKMTAFLPTLLCPRKEKSGYKHVHIHGILERVRHTRPLSCCSIQDRISHAASIKLLKGWPNFFFFGREEHIKIWSVRNMGFEWKE